MKIGEAYDCSVRTVENLRERLVTAGFDAALERKKRATAPTPCKLDGVGEAKLIAMRLGKRRRGMAGGRCSCWPMSWWSWKWSLRSARRRSARL